MLDRMNAAYAFRAAVWCDLVNVFQLHLVPEKCCKISGLLGSEKASRHFSRFRHKTWRVTDGQTERQADNLPPFCPPDT